MFVEHLFLLLCITWFAMPSYIDNGDMLSFDLGVDFGSYQIIFEEFLFFMLQP